MKETFDSYMGFGRKVGGVLSATAHVFAFTKFEFIKLRGKLIGQLHIFKSIFLKSTSDFGIHLQS